MDCCQLSTVHCQRRNSVAVLLACFLLSCAVCVSAAPTVEEQPGRVVMSNEHMRVTVKATGGGAISEVRTSDGRLICSGHALYTDREIYGDGVYVGTSAVEAKLTARTEGGRIIVRSEGILADREGDPPGKPGNIAYWLQYSIGDEPTVRVEWAATPDFDSDDATFFSYVFSMTDCVGAFANTDEGVLLQDMADHSTRTYQSASEPLHPDEPWLGLMYSDGSTIGFTDLQSAPPFANVFFHENGSGGAAVFFAWINGRGPTPLREGEEWRGGFTLGVWDSFEGFRQR